MLKPNGVRPEPVLERLQRCPAYGPTPLTRREGLAAQFGFRQLWLKDESQRMELGSFKALGGAYAVARLSEGENPPKVVVCASAGNHGLSVAAGAKVFGMTCKVYIAATVSQDFADRLVFWGADVVRAGATYEESMEAAEHDAARYGWQLLADSSWEGYREVPRLVMEGYTVIAHELGEQFAGWKEWPSHVFLQAGVGGLAAAITYHIRSRWPSQPEIIIVEPEAAQCLGESVRAGVLKVASGPISNMGRLDCKVPSLLALEILSEQAERFLAVSDDQAQEAAELLSKEGISTTPSGAAGLAGALNVRHELSRAGVLVLVTETA